MEKRNGKLPKNGTGINSGAYAQNARGEKMGCFLRTSENAAANTPGIDRNYMQVFERLLHDADDGIRMEAPEICRVLGKRRPEFVRPYADRLQRIPETDSNRAGRISLPGRGQGDCIEAKSFLPADKKRTVESRL